MNKLQRFSYAIIIYFLGLSIVGVCLAPLLPIKLNPTKSMPRLSVSFSMYGQAPRTVEGEVTAKLEAMLSLVSGVKGVQSTSYNGSGFVNLLLDEHTNVDVVRFEVSTLIRQLWPQLPNGVSYPSVQAGYSDGRATYPFLTYTLNSPSSPNLICEYAEQQIRPKLVQIDGVSNVTVSGATPMEWLLEYDYLHLQQMGVQVSDIQGALSQAMGSGFLGMGDVESSTGERRYSTLFLTPQLSEHFDLSTIPVKKIDGKVLFLNELVKATYREQPPRAYSRINGYHTIVLAIYANQEANQVQLSKEIKAQLDLLKETLPAGYELREEYDASEYIKDEIKHIMVRAGIAVLILLLFVLAVSRSFRYLAVISFSLAANLLLAFIFYYWLGVELQLYSLAGITISLGLVIDNIIVMADHLIHRQKMSIFLAILASTVTTMASLSVLFMLDEQTRLNMQDFAFVIIVNLGVSLLVALFLVPALLQRMGYADHVAVTKRSVGLVRKISRFNQFYAKLISFTTRYRKWVYLAIVLTFGLPMFLLPTSLRGDSNWVKVYNTTLGSSVYGTIRAYGDKITGGTLRIFLQRPVPRQGMLERGETRLHVQAYLPHGATLEEMNETVKRMEYYISEYKGVRQFQTHISSGQSASLSVIFTKEGEKSGVPHRMKSELVSKAISLGNATWTVWGVGDGFNNRLSPESGSFKVEMLGYNYDELMTQAMALREMLLEYQRIREVKILPEANYSARNYEEYLFEAHLEPLAYGGMHVGTLNSAVTPMLEQNRTVGSLWNREGTQSILRLQSVQSKAYDVWDVNNHLHSMSGVPFRLSQMASITKQQMPTNINKHNQQYQLYLEYDYVGDYQLGRDILTRVIKQYEERVPMGYTVRDMNASGYWGWGSGGAGQEYWALVLVALIIYIICCVLFNSFTRPLPIILIIPISYVGLFIGFSLFAIPLGQGGFAAFVLLSGLTCNSVIYLMNDYYSLVKSGAPEGIATYIRAFNGKITPILLTVLSTALGFVPFMFDAQQDQFWRSLSVGTIGGLLFSLVGLFIYLPLMLGVGRKKVKAST